MAMSQAEIDLQIAHEKRLTAEAEAEARKAEARKAEAETRKAEIVARNTLGMANISPLRGLPFHGPRLCSSPFSPSPRL
jgi:hypothetical protein